MDIQETKTVAIKACQACGGGLFERDRFCRWCSARQQEPTLVIDSGAIEYVSPTTPLIETVSPTESLTESFRPVSGPLVKAVAAGVVAAESGRLSSRVARRFLLALISMPIWLIIVLLSPIDAYFAAKAVTRV